MKKLCLILSALQLSLFAADPVVFSATLTTAANGHKLYQPGDPDVPHLLFPADQVKNLPPPTSYEDAIGSATVIYNPETRELKYAVSYTNLSGPPLMMHFHLGFPGVDGPILFTIFGEPYSKAKYMNWRDTGKPTARVAPPGNSGFVTGTFILDGASEIKPALKRDQEEKMLYQGAFYINIHTFLNEQGELRGQLIPLNAPSVASTK